MTNVFAQKREKRLADFEWSNLGDIKAGRGDLTEDMPVLVYRLMQYTMLDVLTKAHGLEKANAYFREAGHLAGTEFTKNVLDISVDFNKFVANLQEALESLRVGILRIEEFDEETGKIALTVAQDLDCSGLPVTNENVCVYDEGFIAGILEAYTKKKYDVKEVDCWASGDRVCRFKGAVVTEAQ